MRCQIFCFLGVAALARLAIAEETVSPSILNIPHCQVVLSNEANLPPLEAGVILKIPVQAGDKVAENQLLLQLDDRKAVKELEVAKAKYAAAKTKAEDNVNIRYAKASNDVAKAAYDISMKANSKVPGSVPQAQLNELLLKCTETALSIEKAALDQTVAKEEANVAAAEMGAAEVMVERQKVLSPIAGEVADKPSANVGEAVQPNQAVIHVVKLDTLLVEGTVDGTKVARSEVDGHKVTVNVVLAGGEKLTIPGEVKFVRPLTDLSGTYIFRAKIENPKDSGGHWQLYPGMEVEMNVQK